MAAGGGDGLGVTFAPLLCARLTVTLGARPSQLVSPLPPPTQLSDVVAWLSLLAEERVTLELEPRRVPSLPVPRPLGVFLVEGLVRGVDTAAASLGAMV